MSRLASDNRHMATAKTPSLVVNFTVTPDASEVPASVAEILASYGAAEAQPLAVDYGYYTTLAKPISDVRRLVAELSADDNVVVAFAPAMLRPVGETTL